MTEKDQILYECVRSASALSMDAFHLMTAELRYLPVAREEIFIKKGGFNRLEYFILEGVCRSYLVDTEGNEVTISFFQGPAILSPHTIRCLGNRSLYYFQAATDCLLGVLDADLLLQMMIQHQEIREFGNQVLRNELIRKVEKEIGLATLTARERLVEFRKKYDMLENIVPHTQIASYLGITPISLSRLRGEIAR